MGKYSNGAATSANPIVSQVGNSILKRGGNAIDAGIAMSLMLSVLEPGLSGLGGGGFAIVHLSSGDTKILDYRETAPLASSPSMYAIDTHGAVIENRNSEGALAIATPGQVAGLYELLGKFGTMDFKELSSFAIERAESGYHTNYFTWSLIRSSPARYLPKLRKDPESSQLFLDEGNPLRADHVLKLPGLARLVGDIARGGPRAFYDGSNCEQIVFYLRELGAIISEQDLTRYATKERNVIETDFEGFKILTLPSPSAGGTLLIEGLNLWSQYSGNSNVTEVSDRIGPLPEILTTIMKDKQLLGDPDFVDCPWTKLISKEYATNQLEKIDRDVNQGSNQKKGADLQGLTSHYCVIDGDGNIVSATESVECFFGSGVAVPGLELLMNDEMHDFDPSPGKPNSIAPGKRPISSMTPVVILDKDDEPFMVVGAAGGDRILTAVLQVVLNVLGRGMTIQEAISHPRIHLASTGFIVEGGLAERDVGRIKRSYKNVTEKPTCDLYFGDVNAIFVERKGKTLIGMTDPRHP